MKNHLEQILKKILSRIGIDDIDPVVDIAANLSHGDYTTNVAMIVARRLKRSPLEIAEEIKNEFRVHGSQFTAREQDHFSQQSDHKISDSVKQNSLLQDIEKIDVAPPGFINFSLSASKLSSGLVEVLTKKEGLGTRKSSQFTVHGSQKEGKKLPRTANREPRTRKIMVEFAHPNTHKAFHIGHLRNITTGEAIVRLLESQGMEVIRANYQGDVGMHIAKAIYALLQISHIKAQISKINSEDTKTKVAFLGIAYAAGSKAFEEDDEAKEKVKEINKKIYEYIQRHSERSEESSEASRQARTGSLDFARDDTDKVGKLYEETRQWSLDYFESIYKRVGTTFKRLYFESEFADSGTRITREAVKKGILTESDGAVVFVGKPYGLDTRVFINSLGLPTYEGKELGLAQKELTEFGYIDRIIHVVGPEQASFFKVTFKVEELLGLQRGQQEHLIYGWVKLKHGKMSSRTGNVVLGEWLIDEAKKAIHNILKKSASKYIETEQEEIAEKAAIAAVKYSFLKVGTRQEIAFDIEKSVNFEGDSGPYLQYTYTRCKSVLRKANEASDNSPTPPLLKRGLGGVVLNNEEKMVMRYLHRFGEVVADAAQNYAPNVLCEYLYDLASLYNTFYNKHSILDPTTDNPQLTTSQRLVLTAAVAQILKNGLYLLGIETLEKM